MLVRADFNVPLSDGVISDDLRIRAALPTLNWADRTRCEGHCVHPLGSSEGRPRSKYSVEPVRERLSELAPCVHVLDNLRFDPGETSNDPSFVQQLIAGHDLYVNDAFGASHRAHASIVGPPQFLPSAAGRLLAKEVEVLLGVRSDAGASPFVAITGGSKVSDKLGVLTALLDIADSIIIGGGMCFTFLRRHGQPDRQLAVRARPDRDLQATAGGARRPAAPALRRGGSGSGGKIGDPSAGGEVQTSAAGCPTAGLGLDHRPPVAAAEFGDLIGEARTVLWNGPMGVFEDPRFEAGTGRRQAVADCRGLHRDRRGDSAAAIAPVRPCRPGEPHLQPAAGRRWN